LTVQHDRAAGRPAGNSEVWNLLDIRREEMDPEFRELCEGLYANKNGQPMGEFVGLSMDLWVSRGNKIPPQFARSAKRIREREGRKKSSANSIPELEALPWAKKS
jgi:hypothetical protein